MSNLISNLLTSSMEIADSQARQVKFDDTILCTVVSSELEKEPDMYYVSNGSIKFKAKNTISSDLKKDNRVYVTIPSGDYSKEKLIVAAYSKDTEENYKKSYQKIDQDFLLARTAVSGNYTNSNFTDGGITETIIINNYDFASDRIYYGQYDRIIIKAGFNVNRPLATAGEYSLKVDLLDSNSESLWSDTIKSSEILGNPYDIDESFLQERIYAAETKVRTYYTILKYEEKSVLDENTNKKILKYYIYLDKVPTFKAGQWLCVRAGADNDDSTVYNSIAKIIEISESPINKTYRVEIDQALSKTIQNSQYKKCWTRVKPTATGRDDYWLDTKQIDFNLVDKIKVTLAADSKSSFYPLETSLPNEGPVQLKTLVIQFGYDKDTFAANHGSYENGNLKIAIVNKDGIQLTGDNEKVLLTPYWNNTYEYTRCFGANIVKDNVITTISSMEDLKWYLYKPTEEDPWGSRAVSAAKDKDSSSIFRTKLNTGYNSNQFKAVYKDIESNIIKISKNDKDFSTSQEDTLIYDIEDDNYNLTYPIYDQDDEVVAPPIQPKFKITGFKNSYGAIGNNKVPMKVVWKIPSMASMIAKPGESVLSSDTKRTWTSGENGWYTTEFKASGEETFWDKLFELQVSLKTTFYDGANNNTIICQIIRDDEPKTTYRATITLHPVRVGTTGEDYGLVITPDRKCLTNNYQSDGEKDKNGRMILTASLRQLSTGSDLTDDFDEEYWYNNLKMEFIKGSFGNIKGSSQSAMTIKKIGIKGISKHSTIIENGQNISDIIAEYKDDIVSTKKDGKTVIYATRSGEEEVPSNIAKSTAAARSYMVRIFSYLTADYFCVVKASFKLRNGRTLIAYQSIPRNYSNSYDVAFEGPGRLVYDSFGKLKTNASGTTYKAINGKQTSFPCVGIWYPGANNENWRQKENNQQINQHEWIKENTNPPSIKREIKNGKFSYKLMPSSTYPKSELQVASLVFYEETFKYRGTFYQTQYDKNGTLLSPEDALGSLNTSHWIYIYPIVIIQDTYFNDTIDAWDGSITQDDEVGMVLATSFAAGKKDSTTNEFTGIIMGDTSGVGNGLFGFSKGKTTFGFTENGSCWIGPKKELRLDADGNDSSFNIAVNKLNIEAGDTETEIGNYFEVDSDNTIFKIGNGDNSYLKFYKPNGGSQYELDIKAYNFTLQRDDNSYLRFNKDGLDIRAKIFTLSNNETSLAFNDTGLTISTQSGTSSFKVDSTNLSITNAKLSGSFEKTDSYGNKILMGEYSNSLVFGSTYETYDNSSCLKIVDESNKYSLGLGVQKTNILETNAAISYIFPRNVTDGTLFISSGYIDSFSDKQNGAKLTLQAGRFRANINNTMDGFSRIILIGNHSGTSYKGEINIETNITRVYGTFSPENGTSDSRLKYSIEEYSSQYDQFFDNLKPVRYKYYHGTSSRYHTGFIAQDIVTGLEEAGLTTQDFAAILKVQWPEYQDIYGEIWQLRRDEIVSLNTWQIQKLKARIIELENKLASFEVK